MTEQPRLQMFAADGVAAPLRHSAFRRIRLACLLSNLGLLIQAVGARVGSESARGPPTR
jgi:hypothetical protein